jgi:hypothetical protein
MAVEVLVDSNVYIDLLRAKRDAVGTLFEWAELHACPLAVCGMIRLEVLRGIVSLKARRKIGHFMDAMVEVPSDRGLWNRATNLAWTLDRQGITIPGADAVIAASALAVGAVILTSDTHFSLIRNLRTVEPPPAWFGG